MESNHLSVHEAARALRDGKLSVPDLLASCLDRLDRTENDVNAWAHVADRSMLAEKANRLQAALSRSGDPGVLYGMPFGVKDLVDTADLPTEAGSEVFRGRRPAQDAECVRSSLDHGGLLLGKTRTHEFAYGVRTPGVANPWELSRTAGGSSGGSAAAVAAGSCMWAIGTDTLGSVRMPASLCGVVGLKPTAGAIPEQGVIPLAWSLDAVGVLTRTCEDAASTFAALRRSTLPALARTPGRLRVGVARADGLGRVQDGVLAVVDHAARTLAESYDVTDVDIPLLEHHVPVGFGLLVPEASSWHEPLLRNPAPDLPPYEQGIHASLLAGLQVRAVDYLRAARARRAVVAAFAELFERIDVLLTPTTPYVAPVASEPAVQWPDGTAEPFETSMCRFTACANVTGLPAVSVPAGLAGGLPVGVQLIGRAHSELDILQVGSRIEMRLSPPIGGVRDDGPSFR